MDYEAPEFEKRIGAAFNNNPILVKGIIDLLHAYQCNGDTAYNRADTFDLDQLLGDATLTYAERKQRLVSFLESQGYLNPQAARAEDYKALILAQKELIHSESQDKKEQAAAEEEQTKQQFSASMKRISEVGKIADIEKLIADEIPSFRSFYGFTDLILSENAIYTQGAIIHGSAGISKSHTVFTKLQQKNIPFITFNSYTTPLALYETLFIHNGKVIVFDDVDLLLHDKKAVAILKAALFNIGGERLITYSSTSRVLEDRGIPKSFIFKGKIILLLNEIPKTVRESFTALINRVYVHQLTPTTEEKIKLLHIVFKFSDVGLSDDDKKALIDFLVSSVNFSNCHKFNLRTSFRAAEIWKLLGREKAEPLIFDLLETESCFRQFHAIQKYGEKLTVAQKVEIFSKASGYSRRKWFEIQARFYNSKYGKAAIIKKEEEDIQKLIDNQEWEG